MPPEPHATDKPAVMITGSTGLIGSRLCRLLEPEYEVYGLDITLPEEPDDRFHRFQCDLTDEESVRAGVAEASRQAGGRFASVIHLAAYYDFAGEPSPLYQELTVDGTQRLLRALRECEVEQFIFSSSMLVMLPVGDDEESIDETSPTAAKWDYPKSKLAAEKVIREERGSTPAAILRIAGVYDEDCHSIPIAQQVKRIYEHDLESHFYPGDTSHGQPYIHLDDLEEAIRLTIERRRELDEYEVLLLAEDILLSYGELQDRIGRQLHGEEWTTLRIPKAVAKAGAWVKNTLSSADAFIKPWMVDLADDHYPLDVSKAKQRLGWAPRKDLAGTLPTMLDRLSLDPESWYRINGLGSPPAERLGEPVANKEHEVIPRARREAAGLKQ
ncbi:UDP-glucose 4-epimerase [Pseudobythopirellula maris]|uniref:UDP-glucose 4-epimerase n=1 Tax=Pseudobythopirellula maris TaxID=2527991 RepID=A0A5C5ZSZ9_9BACT|nr:NAD(P)-dependent oxidoreductase [Pseudobythopirellula maris]TWT90127.1 UDP-glucose 4-epimerase [Pseudobythopirellula maris]